MNARARPFSCFLSRVRFCRSVFFWSWIATATVALGQSPIDRSKWLSTAPGEYLRLIQAGNVSIQASDDLLQQKDKVGATEFKLQIGYRYTYTIESVEEREGTQLARLRVTYQRPKFRITHVIHVESDFSPPDPWSNRLMKHEMDHLAISTDPRIRAIVDGVLGSTASYEFRWEQSTSPSDKQIREEINRASTERISDVEKIIQLAYDQLDDRSMQGNRKIESRGAFFQGLFIARWLQETNLKTFRSYAAQEMEAWGRSVPVTKLEMHYRESWKAE